MVDLYETSSATDAMDENGVPDSYILFGTPRERHAIFEVAQPDVYSKSVRERIVGRTTSKLISGYDVPVNKFVLHLKRDRRHWNIWLPLESTSLMRTYRAKDSAPPIDG